MRRLDTWRLVVVAAAVVALCPGLSSGACNSNYNDGANVDSISGIFWVEDYVWSDCDHRIDISTWSHDAIVVYHDGLGPWGASSSTSSDNRFFIRPDQYSSVFYGLYRESPAGAVTFYHDGWTEIHVYLDRYYQARFYTYFYRIVNADLLVTGLTNLIDPGYASTAKIGLGVTRTTTLNMAPLVHGDLEAGYTRVGFTKSTGTCDFPINAVGVDGDSNNVITLGPFYEPGTYRFCVSKDGGQVYFLQAPTLTVVVVDDPPTTAVTVGSPSLLLSSSSHNPNLAVDPGQAMTSALVAFVPAGTPCAVPDWPKEGKVLFHRYEGKVGIFLSDLYATPYWPVPTSTTFLSSTQSPCCEIQDMNGLVMRGVYYPQSSGTVRFQSTGDDWNQWLMSPDYKAEDWDQLCGPNDWTSPDLWDYHAGQDSGNVAVESNVPRAIRGEVKELGGAEHISLRYYYSNYIQAGELGLPIDYLRSQPLEWFGVTPTTTSLTGALDTKLPYEGEFDLCFSNTDGASWVKQAGQSVHVYGASPTTVTGISNPPPPLRVAVSVAVSYTFTGHVRADGSAQGAVRFVNPGASSCASGDAAATQVFGGMPTVTVTLSTPGLHRICYSASGTSDSSFVMQTAVTVTATLVTGTSVAAMHPRSAGTGTSLSLTVVGLDEVAGTRVAFCGTGPCESCGGAIYGATPYSASPTVLSAPTPPVGTYDLCVENESTGAWVTQAGIRLVSLSFNAISAVEPNVIVAGVSPPPMTWFGAEASEQGTWVALSTSTSGCGTRVGAVMLPTKLGATALSASVSSAGVYGVCYSVNGGSTWTIQGVTVEVVTATTGALGGVSPNVWVVGSDNEIRFDNAPSDLAGVQLRLVGSSNPGVCDAGTAMAASVSQTINPPGAVGSTGYICYRLDPNAPWVVQDFSVTMVGPVTATTVAAVSPSQGNWINRGETVEVNFVAPISPRARFGFQITQNTAAAPCVFDPTTWMGSASYPWDGTPVNLLFDLPVNGDWFTGGYMRLCYSLDGINFVQQTSATFYFAYGSPQTIYEMSPTVVLTGADLVFSYVNYIAVKALTVIQISPDAACTYSPALMGPAGEPQTWSGGYFGRIDMPPGVCYLCLSVDGGLTFVPQVLVPITVIGADAVASIESISPTTVGFGAPFAVNATFGTGTPGPSTRIGFALTTVECNAPTSITLFTSASAVVNPAGLSPGHWFVCWDDGSGGFVAQLLTNVRVLVINATDTSVTSALPNAVAEGLDHPITFAGAVGSDTSALGLSLDGCVTRSGSTEVALPASSAGAVTVSTAGLTTGDYAVCYRTNTAWVAQSTPVVSVVAADPNALTALSPSVVGFGSGVSVTVAGAFASATSQIGFSTNGCATVDAAVAYTAAGPIAVSPSLAPGTYSLCYTVNSLPASWVEQTDPSAVLTVVAATATSITGIVPNRFPALVKQPLALTGMDQADVSATTEISFGEVDCDNDIFGRTSVAAAASVSNVTLGFGLPWSASTMVLCLSVDAGVTWVQQAGVVATIAFPSSSDIVSVSPPVWGTNFLATVTVDGAEDLGFTYLALETSATNCQGGRESVTKFTGNPVTLDLATSDPHPAYFVCYTLSGPDAGWVLQDGPRVQVVAAATNSISAVSPAVVGTGVAPSLAFAGATPSQSSWIAFGVGGCSTTAANVPYTSSGAVALPSALTIAHDTVCYSTDGGIAYVPQSNAGILVVTTTPTSIVSLSPTAVGAGADFVINVNGQSPTEGAVLGFAPVGGCGAGATDGLTPFNASTGLVVPAIAAAGNYDLCFSIDGSNWATQAGLSLGVLAANGSEVATVSPAAVGALTTPIMTVVLNAPEVTATSYVGWSLDPGCAAGTVTGATRLTVGGGINHVALSGVPDAGSYVACFTYAGPAAGWVPQAGPSALEVISAGPLSITNVQPSLVVAEVAPTFTLTGAVATPTTRVSFAPVGQCNVTVARFGDTAMTSPGPLTLSSPLNTGVGFLVMVACYSTDGGVAWVEQSAATVEVSTECSTLTTCAACQTSQFCSYCLTDGTCSFNSSACPPVDLVASDGACPSVVAFTPGRGDVVGGTNVTVAVDNLSIHGAGAAAATTLAPTTMAPMVNSSIDNGTSGNDTDITPTFDDAPVLACQWSLGSATAETPFTAWNATHGWCLSPKQQNNAPAAALVLTWDGRAYTDDIVFFIYHDCSEADYSCGDCVVREAECGFCLETQRCGPSRTCTNGTTFTKEECPRVDRVEPAAINFRGGEAVTVDGQLFIDTGLVQCAFGGVATNETTFVSESEVRCMAPAGDVGTQADVALWVNGREYTTAAGRLLYEDDEALVVDGSVSAFALVGIALVALLLLVAVVLLVCWCQNRKERTFLPPSLSTSQERELMFGKAENVTNGKDVLRTLSPFLELILLADKSTVNFICDAVGSADADGIAKALVMIHEDAGQSAALIQARVSHEVDDALGLATLFRTNSLATKMFRVYSRMAGLHYVRDTLGYEINFNLHQFADANLDIKRSTGRAEDDTLNRFNLMTVCQKVFVAIVKSEPNVPPPFRSIFAHVRRCVEERFPIRTADLATVIAADLNQALDATEENYAHSLHTFTQIQAARGEVETDLVALAGVLPTMMDEVSVLSDGVTSLDHQLKRMLEQYDNLEGAVDPDSDAAARLLAEHTNRQNAVAVGGFFFLRLMIPAITNPLAFQLVAEMPPPNQHKMLVLVSKVLQNLSNGVLFGSKEFGMAELNKFLSANTDKMHALLDRLSTVDEAALRASNAHVPADIPRKVLEDSARRLYLFVDDHLEEIIASMQAVEGERAVLARQCAMLLGNVIAETRQSLGSDSSLASLRSVEGSSSVTNIFASFSARNSTRGGNSFDLDKLRAELGGNVAPNVFGSNVAPNVFGSEVDTPFDSLQSIAMTDIGNGSSSGSGNGGDTGAGAR